MGALGARMQRLKGMPPNIRLRFDHPQNGSTQKSLSTARELLRQTPELKFLAHWAGDSDYRFRGSEWQEAPARSCVQ
jgi:hypothetical protein